MNSMGSLTQDELLTCKRHLLQRQTELITQINERFDVEISQTDAIGELSRYDNHTADLGTELFEREKDLLLFARAEKELDQINQALHALAEGTYGICRVCSMTIPYERLLAQPTADTCIEHATETENHHHPAQYEYRSITPESEPDKETNFYDREDAWQDVSRYGNSDTPSDTFGDQDDINDVYINSDEH